MCFHATRLGAQSLGKSKLGLQRSAAFALTLYDHDADLFLPGATTGLTRSLLRVGGGCMPPDYGMG